MRDFRDATTMARALRDALKAKAVETTRANPAKAARVAGFDSVPASGVPFRA